ncbi:DNA-binding transcriptional LysR family regulator [Desulfohalotomaculum tongense]|uniref:selenium metabolism-associated LysR family transcriptional regulator n=1 Tax=Desulforadius tongensis TaxID=1216062 RepID=UPI00195C5E36|nr:selenium metabolism-associated LysR family transcriptional regulator [Desulforadius tongensis]MBM7855816.1 DNA-binding transcriptional LysR family regulator [Desulforadius tongensis]
MNTTLLKTFVTVVNKKSLSLAAQEIHITQPAVSKHISALEEYFGVGLIERRGRRVTLTPAGEVLYQHANEILNLLHKTECEIKELCATVKGKLVISASSIPGHFILPYIIGAFKKQYPDVHISLQISDSKNVIKHLLDESAHLGAVGREPNNKKLNITKFLTDKLVVITPPSHPLAANKTITLEQLASERLIWRELGSGTRSVLETKLTQRGLSFDELNITMELGSTGAVVNAVEAGLGISIVSQWAIYKEKQLGRIAVLNIEDFNMERDLYLVYPKKRYQNRTVQAFLEFVQNGNYTLPQFTND